MRACDWRAARRAVGSPSGRESGLRTVGADRGVADHEDTMGTMATPLTESAEHALRVVIADPHPTARRALAALLASTPAVALVAVVDALGAAGMAMRRERADVLVADDRLYGAEPAALGPLPTSAKIVVAGMDDGPGIRAYFERKGAAAYVLKDEAHLRLPEVLSRLASR